MGIHVNAKIGSICDYFNLCNKTSFTFLLYSDVDEMSKLLNVLYICSVNICHLNPGSGHAYLYVSICPVINFEVVRY